MERKEKGIVWISESTDLVFFCFILSCCFMIQQITNDFFLSSLDAKKS